MIRKFKSRQFVTLTFYFAGLGYAMVIVSLLIGLYYNVVIAHVLYYLYSSFTSVLPWESCDHEWNTNSCLPFDHHIATGNGTGKTGNNGIIILARILFEFKYLARQIAKKAFRALQYQSS